MAAGTSGSEQGAGVRLVWAPPGASCLTLGRWLHFSGPQFLHLSNRTKCSTHPTGSLRELKQNTIVSWENPILFPRGPVGAKSSMKAVILLGPKGLKIHLVFPSLRVFQNNFSRLSETFEIIAFAT